MVDGHGGLETVGITGWEILVWAMAGGNGGAIASMRANCVSGANHGQVRRYAMGDAEKRATHMIILSLSRKDQWRYPVRKRLAPNKF